MKTYTNRLKQALEILWFLKQAGGIGDAVQDQNRDAFRMALSMIIGKKCEPDENKPQLNTLEIRTFELMLPVLTKLRYPLSEDLLDRQDARFMSELVTAHHLLVTGTYAIPRSTSSTTLRKILSPQEINVLTYIAQGLSSIEISIQLGVSYKTVDFHRTNLIRKLGTSKVADLTHIAISEGLTDLKHSTVTR